MNNYMQSTKSVKTLDDPGLPPPDDMGASFVTHADWFSFTAWDLDVTFLWASMFQDVLGQLIDQGHGGRYYKNTLGGSLGVLVRTDPIGRDPDNRITVEIPGKACQVLGYDRLCDLYQFLNRNASKLHVNRLDIAIDNCNFVPYQLRDAILENAIRTKTHRETLSVHDNPLMVDEAGRTGTQSVEFGDRTSQRYMRCYTKHGFTRLEVEYKDKRAEIVASDFFIDGTPFETAIKHLRDFFDILSKDVQAIRAEFGTRADLSRSLAPWWSAFINGVGRAMAKISRTAKEVIIPKIQEWLLKQVSSGLSVVLDYTDNGQDFLDALVNVGRKRRTKSLVYAPILNL